jgi:predicted nucleic acid-binding Zn ribbon protein
VNQTTQSAAIDCIHCGTANAPDQRVCQRCGVALSPLKRKRNIKRLIFKSLIRIIGLTLILLFLGYISLITTSDPILPNQEEQVNKAIEVLERQGFSKEAFVLRHLVRFRATDSWWNRHIGHQSAYAATNFPFEVVTLYPQFFGDPVDDVERASILLHESYHLFGRGEPKAFEGAWKDRIRLGWVNDRYRFTPVGMSVRESTRHWAPQLFVCGEDGNSDCTDPDNR